MTVRMWFPASLAGLLVPSIQWLNPNRWTLNGYQLGTIGDASVGDCYGPGVANTDFSVYKNFKIREKVNLQFRH